jgi:large subunit ribosomal protein L13
MKKLTHTTTHVTPKDRQSAWFLIDAEGKVAGRLATKVARLLIGKHKADFSYHNLSGDNLILINIDKMVFTGANKELNKAYYTHSGYPGGLRTVTLATKLEKPEALFKQIVDKMLPKNSLRHSMLDRLHVYSGSGHPHEAQQPKVMEIK